MKYEQARKWLWLFLTRRCPLLLKVINNPILQPNVIVLALPLLDSCLLCWPPMVGCILIGCHICAQCGTQRNYFIMFQKQNTAPLKRREDVDINRKSDVRVGRWSWVSVSQASLTWITLYDSSHPRLANSPNRILLKIAGGGFKFFQEFIQWKLGTGQDAAREGQTKTGKRRSAQKGEFIRRDQVKGRITNKWVIAVIISKTQRKKLC